MTSKLLRVIVGAIVSIGILASAASAAYADQYRATPRAGTFTGTSTGATYLRIGSSTLACSTSSSPGTVNAGSGSGTVANGPTYTSSSTWTGAASVTPTFDSCSSGGVAYNVVCTAASLNATTTVLGTSATVSPGTGTTQGTLTGVNCTVRVGATKGSGPTCRVVTGSVTGSYNNSTKQLTINSPTGQALTASTSQSCAIAGGTAIFSGSAGSNTNVVYNVVGTGGFAAPQIWHF